MLEVAPLENKCVSTMEEYCQCNAGTSSPKSECEVFKAVMRGALIHAIATYRTELQEVGLALERKVASAELTFVERPHSDTYSLFMDAQRKYNLHLTYFTQRQLIFADLDKNGRALAFLARTEMPLTVVATVPMINGDLLFSPKDICNNSGAIMPNSTSPNPIGPLAKYLLFLTGFPALVDWGTL